MCDKDFLCLPDEIKVKIFQYLDGVSKQELSKTCKEFGRIYQDRVVLQRLNFYKNYRTSLVHFKLRSPGPLYDFVTHLNISSIYWIPSAQLRYALKKFIKLTYLNVTDTQLTFRDLVTVLSNTTKVKKLAISLRTDHCSDVIFLNIETPITHFYVTYSSCSLRVLYNVLRNFKKLDELWIIEYPIPKVNVTVSNITDFISELPQVHRKFVVTQNSNKIDNSKLFQMMVVDEVNENWIEVIQQKDPYYYFYYNEEITVNSLQKPDFNLQEKLEEKLDYIDATFASTSMFSAEDLMVIINKSLNYSSHFFTYINLARNPNLDHELQNNNPDLEKCFEAFETILFAKNMCRLKKVRLGSLFLHNKKNVTDMVYLPLFKKPRIGAGSSKVTDTCLFSRITNHLTEVEDVEIINDFSNIRISKWDWQVDSLKFISNWTKLKSLTLTSIPFNNGKFFIEVMKSCTQLERLKIKDSSVTDKISYDICTALRYARNLLDFRYEREGSAPIDELFNALSSCLNLQRIYIQCQTTKSISKKPLETLLSKCEKLIFFFIYIEELLETVCKSIKQSISHYDLKPIQIFTIRGRAYDLKNILYDDIPSVHVREMVCQDNNFYTFLESF